jgi:uncharacterized membrane protein
MEKELLIVVPTRAAADEVVKVLQRLDEEGSVELYVARVLAREGNGRVTIEHTRESRAGLAGALAVPVGALIGLLEAPIVSASAVTAGLAAGAAAGVVGAIAYYGIAGDFMHGVASRFKPGSWAVSASLWEDATRKVDSAVMPLHGAVFRQAMAPIVQTQMRTQLQELDQAEEDLERMIAVAATPQKKEALTAERAAVQEEREALRGIFRARVSDLQHGWDGKIAAIRDKLKGAEPEVKARHEAHLLRLSRFVHDQNAAFQQFLQ